jgi:dihydrofolate reductase
MRKINAGVFQSLDGVMQAPGGPTEDPTKNFTMGGWTVNYWDELMGQAMGGAFDAPFDLLLGRKTYEIFAAHWPYMEGDPMGALFNGVNKYVVTASKEKLSWQNSYALNGDVKQAIQKLKETTGPDLLIQGSTELYPVLFNSSLIDQLFVMTFPVVLGHGKRLFASGLQPFAMKLIAHKVSTTGVCIATYVPAGEVSIGSFQRSEPSAAELARQARMCSPPPTLASSHLPRIRATINPAACVKCARTKASAPSASPRAIACNMPSC